MLQKNTGNFRISSQFVDERTASQSRAKKRRTTQQSPLRDNSVVGAANSPRIMERNSTVVDTRNNRVGMIINGVVDRDEIIVQAFNVPDKGTEWVSNNAHQKSKELLL